jgi:hypothetical protein
MNWSQISEQLRIAKLDKATYATLYSSNTQGGGGGSRNNKSMGGGGGYDLYVRKDMECQRRYQKLITDLVDVAMMAEGGGSGSSVGGGGMKRSSASDKKEMSKGPWTEEEDRKVVELVGKYGPKKWSQIASELPGAGE